jgi:hypothetical protein
MFSITEVYSYFKSLITPKKLKKFFATNLKHATTTTTSNHEPPRVFGV